MWSRHLCQLPLIKNIVRILVVGEKIFAATNFFSGCQFCSSNVSIQISRPIQVRIVIIYCLRRGISLICPSFSVPLTCRTSSAWWKHDNMCTYRLSRHFAANKPVSLVNQHILNSCSGLNFGIWRRLMFTVPTACILFSFNYCNGSTVLKCQYIIWFFFSRLFVKFETTLNSRHFSSSPVEDIPVSIPNFRQDPLFVD